MKYTLTDLRQAATGAFLAVIIIFALRESILEISPINGMIVSAIVVGLYWKSFDGMKHGTTHFSLNLIVAFIVSALLSLMFNLVTLETILSKGVFGTFVVVGWWVAIPTALLFDKYNFVNPMRRMFVRGRR